MPDPRPATNPLRANSATVLECIEGPDGCAGPVAMRWPGYGDRTWPRCQHHGDARLQRENEAIDRNGNPDSPCDPGGLEPWDDE